MKTTRSLLSNKGFSILELIIVLIIIGILMGVMVLPTLSIIDRARIKTERQNLAMLADEIRASFRQEDYNLNISALADDMPQTNPDVAATLFSYGTTTDDYVLDVRCWYARLAALRGQTNWDVTTLEETAGDIQSIAFNTYGRRRVLIPGPLEPTRQRYILLSFMFSDDAGPALLAAPSRLSSPGVPNPLYKAWFDEIYSASWGEMGADGPVGTDPFTPNDWSAWEDECRRGKTFAQCTQAERIVQPRYWVTINNLSPRMTVDDNGTPKVLDPDRVYIYTNMRSADDCPSSGGSGYAGLSARVDAQYSTPRDAGPVIRFPYERPQGILAGRRVVIRRQREATNPVPENASTVVSILINENTTYTAQ